ncbi:MAG: flippase-like domain-containing protein [Clostridia bacterium]|nr:flippase-like domain-containing protein [Clostridia bacterium]
MTKRKKYFIDAAIIIVVAALTFYYLFKNRIITAESFSAAPWYAFIACFSVFLFWLCLSALAERLIYGSFTSEMNYGKCFASVAFGNFGSGITPFRSGHFPFIVYYQYKAGVPAGITLTGILKCQIIYSATASFVYGAITVYLAVTGLTATVADAQIKLWMVVATGLVFHIAVFAVITVLAFNPALQRGTLNLVCRAAKKFRKNFNGEKFFAEQSEKLARFKEQISIIGKSFYKYLLPFAVYLLSMAVNGGLQYFAYLFVSGENFAASGFFTFYILNLASTYVANVIPLPGGTGTVETLFTLLFAQVIAEPLLGATLILWRITSYYFPVIAEFIAFLPLTVKTRKISEKSPQSFDNYEKMDYNIPKS